MPASHAKTDEHFVIRYANGKPAKRQPYRIIKESGEVIEGVTDDQGQTTLIADQAITGLKLMLLDQNAVKPDAPPKIIDTQESILLDVKQFTGYSFTGEEYDLYEQAGDRMIKVGSGTFNDDEQGTRHFFNQPKELIALIGSGEWDILDPTEIGCGCGDTHHEGEAL
ncbi:hypothetical protein HNQ59_003882 [Chitinivorax tropicus]|uniref:Uncharacterized protein n=1 Tax=Chitinivorax tropicus TaxID=714531 RepID=A0A840MZJ5_9PROT|nr:hypothetical protein [Chitinivorax tropicus]